MYKVDARSNLINTIKATLTAFSETNPYSEETVLDFRSDERMFSELFFDFPQYLPENSLLMPYNK